MSRLAKSEAVFRLRARDTQDRARYTGLRKILGSARDTRARDTRDCARYRGLRKIQRGSVLEEPQAASGAAAPPPWHGLHPRREVVLCRSDKFLRFAAVRLCPTPAQRRPQTSSLLRAMLSAPNSLLRGRFDATANKAARHPLQRVRRSSSARPNRSQNGISSSISSRRAPAIAGRRSRPEVGPEEPKSAPAS